MSLVSLLGNAANSGVPIVAVRTADQPAVAGQITACFGSAGWAVVCWDSVRGCLAGNSAGTQALALLTSEVGDASILQDFTACLAASLAVMPQKTVLLAQGAHRTLFDSRPAQAVLNLRDSFAQSGRMLVLLGPDFDFPRELGSDVLVIDDPLPDAMARAAIVDAIVDAADVEVSAEMRLEAQRSTRGLSQFAAGQVVAMATIPGVGIDVQTLRARWREAINSTAGLAVDDSGATLDNVAGLESYKAFALSVAAGKSRPQTVVRLDEIEKALGGALGGGDTSGVSQGILGALLTWMEENAATGIIAVGPPGAGKSLCSVATGAACGAPTVTLDVGALKGSLVGQSEERARTALRTLAAVAGKTFWIATCNSLAAIPPELRRRFRYGIWFFDLPNAAERKALWSMYGARFELDPLDLPANDRGWSGAEIRNCCEMASDLRISPREAAAWIVPAAISSADAIEALRKSAAGKYLSATEPGPYVYRGSITSDDAAQAATPARKLGGFGAS